MNREDWMPPTINEVYIHYCKRNKLNPDLSTPAELFSNNCYAVACAMTDLMGDGARAVYGGWLGDDVRRKEQPPFHRHGWVEYQGHLLDPTRFQFEGREPYMYIAFTAGKPHKEYDEGMSALRKGLRRPPPKRDETYGLENKEFKFKWAASDKDFLTILFGEERDWNILTLTELFWLSNLTPAELEPIIGFFYPQLAEHDLLSFVPMDHRLKYNHWVRSGEIGGEEL